MAKRVSTDLDRPIEVLTWEAGVPIRRVPIALARRFVQVCTGVIAETLAGEDLSPLEYGVLVYLGDEPDIDQIGLAARLATDRNTTSVLVERLERRGLIERRVNGADRRARQVRLTQKGDALQRRLRAPMRASQRRILEALPPGERDVFLDQLVRIIKANEAYARPGAGRRSRAPRSTTSTEEE
jgi:DNA-binding MarR family transcriptional regulator